LNNQDLTILSKEALSHK